MSVPPSLPPSRSEQKGIILSFVPPPSLVGGPSERGVLRERIAVPVAGSEDRPATVRDLRETQEALLLDLRIAEAHRPPPEIDIHKIRDLLDREFDREVKCGLTFYTAAP